MLYEQTSKKDKALEQWQKFVQITEGVKSQKVWLEVAKGQMKRLENKLKPNN